MRALILVVALATAPFFVGVSQSPQGLNCDNGQGDENRSDSGEVHAHRGHCVLEPPPPPPGCVNSGPGTGAGMVEGQVYLDDPTQNFPYLTGWCVELRDVSGAVVATAVTSGTALDSEGNNYIFTGVPPGTYTVCEELPANSTFHETSPTSGADCGGGVFGFSFTIADGSVADFLTFANLP
ncbi:MAG TPA: hypothetical protein VIV88_17065 [Gemmatimonadales bacterium]